MIDDLERVGDILKRTRTAKGISLSLIAKRTKISRRYLEAIEQGSWDALPNEVFVRAFLRQFSRALGLEEEEMVELYRKEVDGEEEVSLVTSRPSPSLYPWIIGGFIVIALAVAGFYLFHRSSRPVSPVTASAAPTAVTVSRGASSRLDEVVMTFSKDCWITVTLDNNKIYEGLKHPGDELRYIMKDSFILKAGDGSALTMKRNGVPCTLDTLPGRPTTVTLHAGGASDGRNRR